MRSLAARGALLLVWSVGGLLHAQSEAVIRKANAAREAMMAGRYADAVNLYRQLVAEMPNEPGMHLNLGLALEKAGRPSEAIPELGKVTRAQPGNANAWFLLGLAYAQLKRPHEAVPPLKEAVRLDRSNSQALLELADAELGSDDCPASARDFAALAAARPQMPKAWEGLGLARLCQSEYARLAVRKQAPGSAYDKALEAADRAARGESEEALRLYAETLRMDPKLAGIHDARARIYRELGRADLATSEQNAEAANRAGACPSSPLSCLYYKGDWAKLLAAAAAVEAKSFPEAFYWNAVAALELAQQSFAELAKLPPSPESHELLADFYQRSGRRLDAVEEWRKALALDPENARLRANQAASLYHAREYGEAEALLKPLAASRPENPEFQYLLGSVLYRQKRDGEALPYLERASELEPDFLPVQENLGLVYLNLNQPEKAIRCLERARPLDDGSISFALSAAYRKLGRMDEARAALARYRELQKNREAAAQ